MNNTIKIAKKLLKVKLRSPESFITYLAFPLVLILILGSAFSGMFGEMELDADILYYSNNRGHLTNVIEDNFHNLEGFTFKEIKNVDDGKNKVFSNFKS